MTDAADAELTTEETEETTPWPDPEDLTHVSLMLDALRDTSGMLLGVKSAQDDAVAKVIADYHALVTDLEVAAGEQFPVLLSRWAKPIDDGASISYVFAVLMALTRAIDGALRGVSVQFVGDPSAQQPQPVSDGAPHGHYL